MKGLARFIKSDKFFYFVLAAILGVYIAGMFVDVMEVDAAQYAAMSMEMLQRGDYLHFYDRGNEYLDKPPLLFWLTALSFKLFGLSSFTYKLPSVLASLLAIYSTYEIGRLWYDKETGRWAAIILAACQAFFVYNNDVRTDALLTGFVTFSIWQLSAFIRDKRALNFIFGFIGIGFAMLAKGPIGLIVPAAAFGTHFLLRREWKMVFKWQWLIGLLIILAVLSPMLYGLYTQFDMHPEKTVNGQTGVSGLRFFFWTQSFGRITGESEWQNQFSGFFFIPTFMWMFLPWTLWFLWAFIKELITLAKKRFKLEGNEEGFTIGGFLLIFIAVSLSRYKLPHYILVIMPLASLLLAKHFWIWQANEVKDKIAQVIKVVHPLIILLLAGLVAWLVSYIFPVPAREIFIVVSIIVIFSLLAFIYNRGAWRIISSTALVVVAVNILFNTWFFPQLLDYQSGSQLGRQILEENVPVEHLRTFNLTSHALDFYTHSIVPQVHEAKNINELRASGPVWVYTDEAGYEQLKSAGFEAESIQSFPHQHVSLMSTSFLNPDTRQEKLRKRYLLRY
jgi:4-amino-4-deoxy-L-arabinose transferase-like glycosyltransferase